MNATLQELTKRLAQEFVENGPKPRKERKPRAQHTGPGGPSRQQQQQQQQEEKRQLKALAKQDLKSVRAGRTIPLNKLVKDALDYLSQVARPVSREDLEARLGLTLHSDPELRDQLHRHPKIKHREGVYEYVFHYRATNRAELLDRIREHQGGVQRRDIRENYPTIDSDVSSLRGEGLIYVIQERGKDQDDDLLIYRDRMGMEADAEVLAMWRQTEVPGDTEGVKQALEKAGLRVAPRVSERKTITGVQQGGRGRKKRGRGKDGGPPEPEFD